MGADHGEGIAERDEDPGGHSRQFRAQHHVLGHVPQPAVDGVVVPVHAPEIAGVGGVATHALQTRQCGRRNPPRVGELRERGQHDALLTEAPRRPLQDTGIHDSRAHAQRLA